MKITKNYDASDVFTGEYTVELNGNTYKNVSQITVDSLMTAMKEEGIE